MAFNIEQFKSNFADGGARPNLFRVRMNFPAGVGAAAPTELAFVVRAAQIPSSTIAQIDVPYFGRQVRVAGNRTFEPWTVTVINTEEFAVRNSLEQWMNAINQHNLNTQQFASNSLAAYKSNAFVEHYGKDGQGSVIARYEFRGLFPTELGAVELSWDANDQLEEFTATFAYDYWQHDNVVTS